MNSDHKKGTPVTNRICLIVNVSVWQNGYKYRLIVSLWGGFDSSPDYLKILMSIIDRRTKLSNISGFSAEFCAILTFPVLDLL
jgi:hypothetical protein